MLLFVFLFVFPQAFFSLSFLEKLDLSWNQLTALPVDFSTSLSGLRELRLEHNNLHHLSGNRYQSVHQNTMEVHLSIFAIICIFIKLLPAPQNWICSNLNWEGRMGIQLNTLGCSNFMFVMKSPSISKTKRNLLNYRRLLIHPQTNVGVIQSKAAPSVQKARGFCPFVSVLWFPSALFVM